MEYLVRQPNKADRVFTTSDAALRHIVGAAGYAKLYCDGQLIMTKGIPAYVDTDQHDPRLFRGILSLGADA